MSSLTKLPKSAERDIKENNDSLALFFRGNIVIFSYILKPALMATPFVNTAFKNCLKM